MYLFVFVVVKSDENNTEEKKDETSSLPELKIEILEEGEGCGIPTTNTSRVLVYFFLLVKEILLILKINNIRFITKDVSTKTIKLLIHHMIEVSHIVFGYIKEE